MELNLILKLETEEAQMLFDAMNIFMKTIYSDPRMRMPYMDHTNFAKSLNYKLMPFIEQKNTNETI